jgi:hypothetical protein
MRTNTGGVCLLPVVRSTPCTRAPRRPFDSGAARGADAT